MRDPFALVAFVLLVMWGLEALWHRLDLRTWESERERLLDRWQSPSLEQFKAAQRLLVKQRRVDADQPGSHEPAIEYADEGPDDLETAPAGEALVGDVISGRARASG